MGVTGQTSSPTTLPVSRPASSDADTMTRTTSTVAQLTVSDDPVVKVAWTLTPSSAATTNPTQSVASSRSPLVSASGPSVTWPTTRRVLSASSSPRSRSPVPTNGTTNWLPSSWPTKPKQIPFEVFTIQL